MVSGQLILDDSMQPIAVLNAELTLKATIACGLAETSQIGGAVAPAKAATSYEVSNDFGTTVVIG